MQIKIQIRGCVYSVCIGYKAAWYWQESFITVAREYYQDDQLSFAELIFRT